MSESKNYLAKPIDLCCLSGTLHEGEPRGKLETISDIETYIATPKADTANGNIVLYFPDVWGLFNNGKLIMDCFADAGYLTLGLDYFRGDDVTKHRDENNQPHSGFDFAAWANANLKSALEFTPGWIEAVKEKYGKENTKYACTGYCFGGPFVCNALGNGAVSVGAFGHPAFLEEHHFANLKGPLFLSCSETDFTFGPENRRKAEEVMTRDKKTYQFQLFSGVNHGFALRCNLDDPYEKYVKEQSFIGIIGWFDFWLSKK
ncbi:alpha/beta-hydrolase [Tothia fuscella]|uniref:Alpha/beta-hydrolase n=1 Tax=Tothia fuscella TaxID=1048955 RepID=A0A9P4TXR8_9PEZI|nr:alpha/beta-hydrolase [Tothia fuscella]